MNNQPKAKGQIINGGKQLYTEIVINAAPEKVWAVLSNFAAYPEWNPFVKSLTGALAIGQPIDVLLQSPDGKAIAMKPTLLQYTANKELRWIGKLFLSHIFDGEHAFVLHDNGNGTTTFMQYENFRGVLVPFLKKMLDGNTRKGFELMNVALKERVERVG